MFAFHAHAYYVHMFYTPRHPDGPPPETTTKDTTISDTPAPDGTDKLASENSALRLRKSFGDKLSKLFSKMKPMRQRFDSAIAYLRKFIGKIKSIKQWVRTKPYWESSSVIQAKEMAIPDPVPGPFEIPPMRTGIKDSLMARGNLDEKVNEYFSKRGMSIGNFHMTPISQGEDHVKSVLRNNYKKLGDILKNEAKMEGAIDTKIEEMTAAIRQSLTKEEQLSEEAMANLGERISNYKAEMLLKDQESKNSLFLTLFCLRIQNDILIKSFFSFKK
jgi:hypothetical protein